jgi:hypothetical protein
MSATHIHVDGIVLIIFLLFSSLVVLLGFSVYILRSDIEITLMDNVMERLEEEEFQFAVEFNGRDGIISGSVKNESIKKEVISIAESVEGVRSIKSKLEIISTPTDKKNNPTKISGLLGITEDTSMVDSLNEIITTAIPKPTLVDPEIDGHKVSEGEKDRAEILTEITEKPIIEEVVIQFKPEETKLSSLNEVFLSVLVTKLKNDSSLFIEISSFHSESRVAIKRAKSIKDYFISNGVDKKHFDILWHDSESESKVQLKLFYNEEY